MSAPQARSPGRDGGLLVESVGLPGGPRLAVRRADGVRRPFLLVHGLASNARLWDGVAHRLAAAGHAVAAVDLRGHGESEQTVDGYDTPTVATDLAALVGELGWTGALAPVVAGQSWGGNVALDLAARARATAGLALVDGGWIHLADRFADFEDCWRVLAPPSFDGLRRVDLEARLAAWTAGWPPESVAGVLGNFVDNGEGTVRARLAREHHREILRSLWEVDPRPLYPRVSVPALLLVADGDGADGDAKRTAVHGALAGLPDAEVRWYTGAHHDLHAQQPERTATDLLALAARVEARA